MNPDRDHGADPSQNSDHASIHDLVQEILDRPADDPRRLELLRTVRDDDAALHELNATAESLYELRARPIAPDLTSQILDAADARRRFLPARVRRWVVRGRLAAAAMLLFALGTLAIVERVAPGVTDFTPRPRTLSSIPAAFQHDATQSAAFVRSGVRQAGKALAPVVEQPGWAEEGTEVPTAWVLEVVGRDGSVYDTVMTFDPDARGEQSLRVFRTRRPEASSLLCIPEAPPVIAEPDTRSLP